MYLLIHSLVLVLVAVMKPKELKTKISHANPLTLSLRSPILRPLLIVSLVGSGEIPGDTQGNWLQ